MKSYQIENLKTGKVVSGGSKFDSAFSAIMWATTLVDAFTDLAVRDIANDRLIWDTEHGEYYYPEEQNNKDGELK